MTEQLRKNKKISTEKKETIDSFLGNQQQIKNFAQRYIDEIASSKKLKQYEEIASRHKDILLKESRLLRKEYSQSIQEGLKMEQTVSSISSMINDFALMIESQSEIVQSIDESGKDVTKSMEATDEELYIALKRSQSQQYTMIIFILFLSFLLLTIDLLSP